MQRKIRKAVIPAAGLGTRFLPATKAQPKEMLPIVDKPTLQLESLSEYPLLGSSPDISKLPFTLPFVNV